MLLLDILSFSSSLCVVSFSMQVGIADDKIVHPPLVLNVKFAPTALGIHNPLPDPTRRRQVVRITVYHSTFLPDITFAVIVVS